MTLIIDNKNRIVILQHNVTHWKTNSSNHFNIYKQHDPDILLLNETGIKEEDELKIFQYICYKTNHSNEIHDGVVIAIKRNLKHKLLKIDHHNCICIQLETSLGPINIATTYLPPRRAEFPYQELMNLFNRQEPTYVIADFNATHQMFGNASANRKGNAIIQLMNRGIVQHHGPPFKTWFGHVASTPDKVLTNNKVYHNMLIEKGSPCCNDHLPVLVTISTSPIVIPTRQRYNVAKTNWDYYRECLMEYTPKNLESATTEEIEEEIENINNVMKTAIKETTPIIKNRVLPSPKLPHDVRVLQARYMAILEAIDSINGLTLDLRIQINAIRIELREKLKNYSEQLWNSLISKIKTNDPKEFWKSINRLLGHDSKDAPYIINRLGQRLESAEEIAEEFCEIMEEVFNGIDNPTNNFDDEFKQEIDHFVNELSHERTVHFEKANISRHDDDILSKITIEELNKYILTMNNKAPGNSGIKQIHLKNATLSIKKGYCNVFNTCLTSGYFPKLFKLATVTMVPKPGKRVTFSSNYRPK